MVGSVSSTITAAHVSTFEIIHGSQLLTNEYSQRISFIRNGFIMRRRISYLIRSVMTPCVASDSSFSKKKYAKESVAPVVAENRSTSRMSSPN